MFIFLWVLLRRQGFTQIRGGAGENEASGLKHTICVLQGICVGSADRMPDLLRVTHVRGSNPRVGPLRRGLSSTVAGGVRINHYPGLLLPPPREVLIRCLILLHVRSRMPTTKRLLSRGFSCRGTFEPTFSDSQSNTAKLLSQIRDCSIFSQAV